MMIKNCVLLLGIICLVSCSTPPPAGTARVSKITAASEKSTDSLVKDSLRADAKKIFEISETHLKKDTLEIVSGSGFFYYPFGKYHNIADFIKGNNVLRKYHEEKQVVDSTVSDSTILHKFTYNNSYLTVFNSSDTKSVEIVKAYVADPDINLNEIKIGMGKKDFLNVFFNNVDNSQIKNVKVIIFKSVVDGIWNNYYFKDDKLIYYTFDTDYVFNNKNQV